MYGHAFYFDQPVKRIWYSWSVLRGDDYWRESIAEVFYDPARVPNELYRLFRGEHRFEPSVVVNSETIIGAHLEGDQWVDAAVIGEIRQLTQQGFSRDRIREIVINVDDAVRRIRCLRSALTVNAGLYYDRNESIISDEEWDLMALKLVEMQQRYFYVLPFVDFFDSAFDGFDGSTGFHLPYRVEPFLTHMSRAVEFFEKHRKV
ncbi:hypothetical protein pEaSNUABM37_00124 [Erwinia phage pEa_SNUABM_37]|nr:hypothetical protein pEaSNUABM37_00124 [Erwinia phage pEa_SNUABM_37]QXO10594.1 hypothetical protein pEaSNUABM48_00124 [Erwinia phage pEa_SNUABM_48]